MTHVRCKILLLWSERKQARHFNDNLYFFSNFSNSSIPFYPCRHEMYLRDLNQIFIDRDISQTSQKHLKRDVSFVTSLRRLKCISKKMFFCVTSLRRLKNISKKMLCDVFKTSQAYLKKMSFPWRLWDVSKTSLASIFGFSKIRHNNDSTWFRRVITISDKIDVGPSETFKKLNVWWEQCTDINQV